MKNPGVFCSNKNVWLISYSLSVILHVSFFFLWWGEEASDAVSQTPGSVEGLGGGSPFSRIQVVRVQSVSENTSVRPVVPIVELELVPAIQFEITDNNEVSSLIGDISADWAKGLINANLSIGDSYSGGGTEIKVPPLPRSIVIPQIIAGQGLGEIQIEVFVDESGKVVSDSTRIFSPNTSNSVQSQLFDKASEWVFDPARIADKPVSSWFSYTIRM